MDDAPPDSSQGPVDPCGPIASPVERPTYGRQALAQDGMTASSMKVMPRYRHVARQSNEQPTGPQS